MLKRLFILFPLLVAIVAFLWARERIQTNPVGVFPTPYVFSERGDKIAVDSPLLIVGDRMAKRFGLFKEALSYELSIGLSKPLKTDVMASERYGLHRTLQQVSMLEKWPRIMIYTGGSEEMVEKTFRTSEIPKIRQNFNRYNDDYWRTLMMLWPESARLIYTPLIRQVLGPSPSESPEPLSESDFQLRLELSLKLYELELIRLVENAKENGTLLILMTVPINLDIPPKKTCKLSQNPEVTKELQAIRELIKQQDYKAAYPRSQLLMQSTLANSEVFFLHGQVAYRIGQVSEAKKALQSAAAFDCQSWRATQVNNNIIRKVAQDYRITLFDFALMVESDWRRNATFFDEIYPQDFYYQKAAQALGLVLRRMLKL